MLVQNLKSRSDLFDIIVKFRSTISIIQRYYSNVKNGKTDQRFCHPLVIGHRGAPGYIPEHTLASYALAVLMGADYIETDLVATCDHHIIARHGNELGISTDVAKRPEFACRRTTKIIDGVSLSGWFTEDFTLKEIKSLRAIESFPEIRPGNTRFNGACGIPTLQEIINLVKCLGVKQNRVIVVCLEIKHSTYFRNIGLPIEQEIINIIHKKGYSASNTPFCIMSFEKSNLEELKKSTELKLVQLYDLPSKQPFDKIHQDGRLTYRDLATPDGLREVAKYACCVGVEQSYVIPRTEDNKLGKVTNFVQDAHAAGLRVLVYTFRAENYFLPIEYHGGNCLPSSIGNFKQFLYAFIATGIDGLICDHPDLAVCFRKHYLKTL